MVPQTALFVCTENSARSQLAAALWTAITGAQAISAGIRPADKVHRQTVAAAARAGLSLSGAQPRHLDEIIDKPALVITVCDQAHEELLPSAGWLHWSLPDPVDQGRPAAFDASIRSLRARITALLGTTGSNRE